MQPVLKLREVTKLYGKAVGVQGVSFEVDSGMVFGFLGPNGAGKTTTINMIVDLLRPTQGSIEVFGLDSVRDSVEIRRRIGFLAGDMSLDRSLTGWQQLEYLGNLRGEFDRQYVRELAERLDCRLERSFKTLSRGNKQKVGLVAALMHKPDLLILDEPTSGLDPLIQAEFNKLVLEHKRAGKTVFVSSHVLSEVQEICDTVTFIRDGKIIDTKQMSSFSTELPKMFRVQGGGRTLQTQLRGLKGVKALEGTAADMTGTFSGDVNALLKLVSKHKMKDFSLHDTDLETAFMKYYGDKDA